MDLGTGTGVLPRKMYRYGAQWIGTDISENQIRYAEELENWKIEHKRLLEDIAPPSFSAAMVELKRK